MLKTWKYREILSGSSRSVFENLLLFLVSESHCGQPNIQE